MQTRYRLINRRDAEMAEASRLCDLVEYMECRDLTDEWVEITQVITGKPE